MRAERRTERASDPSWKQHQRALLSLALDPSLGAGDLQRAFRKLTETAAENLGVERCGVWLFDDTDRSILRCDDQFVRTGRRHSSGTQLNSADFPVYFHAMQENRAIVADDAVSHPLTREFRVAYLEPLGVTSMIDAPIRVGGRTVGVVCHEHVGPKRVWSQEEQMFAASISDMASLALDRFEQRKTEAALRESEKRIRELLDEKYHALTEAIPDAIFVADSNGNITYANKAGTKLLGYRREDFDRRTISTLFPASHFQRLTEACRGKRNVDRTFELAAIRKGGAEIPVDVKVCHYGDDREPYCIFILRDMTERRAEQEHLKLFREIFLNSREAIAVFDPKGTYFQQNESHRKLFGFQDRELLGKTPSLLLDSSIYARIASELARRGVFKGELSARTKRGSPLEIDLSAFTVRDPSGTPLCYVAVLRDVTERKRIEEEILRSRAQFQTLFEQVGIGMSLMTPEGRFVQVNRKLCDITGYPREEYLGKTVLDLTPPEDVPLILAKLSEHKAEAWRRQDFNVRCLRKDGRVILLRINAVGLPADSDRPEYFVAVIEDISEKVKTEEQVRLLASITSASTEGIMVLDREQRVLFMNEAAERIHGYSAGEVRGESARKFFVPPDKEEEFRSLTELRPGVPEEVVMGLRTERLHKSGRRIPVSLTTFSLQEESTADQKRVVIFQDMTHEEEMRERLLEQSNMAAIGEMAASMAHEIRNPLFAISAAAQVLAREPGAGETTRELADSMFGEIVRLNQLLENVLLYAKPARLERKATDLRQLFGEIVDFHRVEAEGKSLRLRLDFPPGAPLAEVDPQQIKQVFRNLYLNAVQASPPRGLIEVHSRIDRQTARWDFEIANEGEPIDPQKISSIFKPFVSTKREGVGLGLSICKKIVEAHGGSIQCRSRPGESVVFRFGIPLGSALTDRGGSA